jgi:hypothetical protein
MKLKNLLKLYKVSKNWEFNNNKLSIPDYDLDKLDIRMGEQILDPSQNPLDTNAKGEYLPPMTEEDYTKWQQQKTGWAAFYDKVKGYADKKQD